jgi:hypothetical protein
VNDTRENKWFIAASATLATSCCQKWAVLRTILKLQKMRFLSSFKETLFEYGIHRDTLFPDLDGQARFIEWAKSDYPAPRRDV